MIINKLEHPLHVFYSCKSVQDITKFIDNLKHDNLYLHIINKNKSNTLLINALRELYIKENLNLRFENINNDKEEIEYLKEMLKYKNNGAFIFVRKIVELNDIERINLNKVDNKIVSHENKIINLIDITSNNYEICVCDTKVLKNFVLSNQRKSTTVESKPITPQPVRQQPVRQQPVRQQPVRQQYVIRRPQPVSRRRNMGMFFN